MTTGGFEGARGTTKLWFPAPLPPPCAGASLLCTSIPDRGSDLKLDGGALGASPRVVNDYVWGLCDVRCYIQDAGPSGSRTPIRRSGTVPPVTKLNSLMREVMNFVWSRALSACQR